MYNRQQKYRLFSNLFIWSLYDDESKDGDVEMKEKVSIPEDQEISIYKTQFCKKYMQRYTNPETMKAERQIFISDYDSYYYISMKLNKVCNLMRSCDMIAWLEELHVLHYILSIFHIESVLKATNIHL